MTETSVAVAASTTSDTSDAQQPQAQLDLGRLQQLLNLMSLEEDLQVNDDTNIATDCPISFKTTDKDISLVNGFIHIHSSLIVPKSITQLILETYLKLLFIDNYGNTDNRILLWNFTNKQDVDLYFNTKYNDVITSSKVSINHCLFYLECTPRGWGRWRSNAAVWCALYELPPHISQINVNFRCKCDAVEYNEEETKILTTRATSLNGNGSWSMAPNKLVDCSKFDGLKSFTFECSIKILQVFDIAGNEILSTKDSLKKIIIEQSQKQNITKLDIIKQLQIELSELEESELQLINQ